jgi:predicted nuclease of restriction endonuclease-like (RecB) superfamily
MKQFFEAYQADPKLAPLVREIGWSSNLLILAQARTPEERGFYLEAARDRHWTKRELERQLESGLFERVRLGEASLSPALRKPTRKNEHRHARHRVQAAQGDQLSGARWSRSADFHFGPV